MRGKTSSSTPSQDSRQERKDGRVFSTYWLGEPRCPIIRGWQGGGDEDEDEDEDEEEDPSGDGRGEILEERVGSGREKRDVREGKEEREPFCLQVVGAGGRGGVRGS